MLGEVIFTAFKVVIPVKNVDKNKEVLASIIVNHLLKQLSTIKATEYGYFLAVTKLIRIGLAENTLCPHHILFPVDFYCQTFKPVYGEVMTGIVYRVSPGGVFLKSGPMDMVYLASQKMPNYHYVPGENRSFIRDDLSKIEIDVVVRYMVFAVRWKADERRGFRVLASIDADGLGPVSLNGRDGLDL